MTTTHTAASLAALHADDPRKLDALAHSIVCPDKNTMWINPTKFVYVDRVGPDWGAYPSYSASLDAAAMLEARLAERGLYHDWYVELSEMVDLMDMPRATAAQRTIAAILATQEATK